MFCVAVAEVRVLTRVLIVLAVVGAALLVTAVPHITTAAPQALWLQLQALLGLIGVVVLPALVTVVELMGHGQSWTFRATN
jgi:hypothetical protein